MRASAAIILVESKQSMPELFYTSWFRFSPRSPAPIPPSPPPPATATKLSETTESPAFCLSSVSRVRT